MPGGQCRDERFLVQRTGRQSLHLYRQRQDAEVDVAVMRPLEHRLGLVLVQHQFQARQRLANLERDQRQQVGTDRGQ